MEKQIPVRSVHARGRVATITSIPVPGSRSVETIGKQRVTSAERGLVEKEGRSGGSFSTRPRSSLVPRCFPIVSIDRELGTG